MQVLLYNELNPKAIPGLVKLIKFLENDDFHSAWVLSESIAFFFSLGLSSVESSICRLYRTLLTPEAVTMHPLGTLNK